MAQMAREQNKWLKTDLSYDLRIQFRVLPGNLTIWKFGAGRVNFKP